VIEADGFDSNQRIAWPKGRQLLYIDIDHLRTAGAKRPGYPTPNRLIHDESRYHRPARRVVEATPGIGAPLPAFR
jgi:hypothetical protein